MEKRRTDNAAMRQRKVGKKTEDIKMRYTEIDYEMIDKYGVRNTRKMIPAYRNRDEGFGRKIKGTGGRGPGGGVTKWRSNSNGKG